MYAVAEDAMGSVIKELANLLHGEYKLFKETKDNIMFLKAELVSMHVFLKKMSDTEEEPDEQTKCWVGEVRELSYDIEDNIYDFLLHSEHESNNTPQLGFRGFIDKCVNLLSHFSSKISFGHHHETIYEFQGLKRRVVEASERRTRYKLDDAISKPTNKTIDLRLLALYAEVAALVGIEGPKGELIQLMMDEKSVSAGQLKVLSIVGFGGLGKTTLANQIYRQLETQFESRAFISVSQKPNIRKILRHILSQVGYDWEDTKKEIWDEDKLIRTLQQCLKNKRYFIVIDDIWDEITWNIIRCALPETMKGSRVITTTRIDTVGMLCCSNHSEYVYRMKPLSNQESRQLFFKRIFGSEDVCPPFLEEVSGKILKRCGGLPLAIITISSLLASQRYKLKGQWEHVLNSLGSNLEVHPTLEGMRQILSLSYKNLPHYLKTCMLYIGIYQEDHTIEKNDLVRQWVAQGFISKAHGRDLEDVGEGYFNELVNRSIVQPVDTNSNDEVLSCRIHDMMLDLILHKCREENFITAINELQDMVRLHDRVRRLSLNPDSVIDATVLGTIWLSQASNIWYLKAIAAFLVLPEKIQGLQQLETMELGALTSNSIRARRPRLPSDIVHLPRLLHLTIPLSRFPDGIGNMATLRTLRHFDLSWNSIDNIRELGGLTGLRDLRIAYTSSNRVARVTNIHMDALNYALEKHCSPKSSSGCFLQRLHLRCNLPRVPKSTGELHNLHHLELQVIKMVEDDVGILARLQSLINLELHIFGTPKRAIMIGTGFPVLQCFSITCIKISFLTFEAGAMSRLKRLAINFNAHGWEDQQGAPPVGIEQLSGLKEVAVLIGCHEAKDSDKRAAQSALGNAVDVHTGRPTANIRCKESWFSFEDFGLEDIKILKNLT
ncbi:disease resistance protein RGA5-like [Aegilops tauschii subsp. strangulata]|uniref:Disease resistance protein RPP13 n=1 Tax=Aegilops tauschii TaxID=37682 RepID=M8B237_AEGTA